MVGEEVVRKRLLEWELIRSMKRDGLNEKMIEEEISKRHHRKVMTENIGQINGEISLNKITGAEEITQREWETTIEGRYKNVLQFRSRRKNVIIWNHVICGL